ncbi:MAG: hypothetical protein IH583_14205, partial [Candidatus Aminicenantes bacterium]|nr:hypothetical protein [Candidatus Aminicenantes bacterium]
MVFRIRRIYDDILPIDKDQLAQSLSILRAQFPLVKEEEIQKIPDRLRKPHGHGLLAM